MTFELPYFKLACGWEIMAPLPSSFTVALRAPCCRPISPFFRLTKLANIVPYPLASNRCYSAASATVSSLQINVVPCLVDNYAYVLHDESSGSVGVVDPSEAEPIVKFLEKRSMKLNYVLNTHHHWDHTGGNSDLKKHYGAQIVAPVADGINGIDVPLHEGDTWMFGGEKMQVISTPGHTKGHVSLYFPESKAVFTGDTLFSIGCGRLFEGSADQMWSSLSKLLLLPDDTRMYCGHEYTLSNAKFALTVEPKNKALLSYLEKAKELRTSNSPTIPSSIGEEKRMNPFLRPFSAEIRKSLNVPNTASYAEVFAALRKAKDAF